MAEKEVPEKNDFYKELDNYVADYQADKKLHNMADRSSVTDHDHRFSLVPGNQAYCNCGWGLYLDDKDELRDGKIYRAGVLVV